MESEGVWAHPRCAFRIRYHFRKWRGKPDPDGLGVQFVYSNDPSWIHEEAMKLKSQGHWGVRIERRQDV